VCLPGVVRAALALGGWQDPVRINPAFEGIKERSARVPRCLAWVVHGVESERSDAPLKDAIRGILTPVGHRSIGPTIDV